MRTLARAFSTSLTAYIADGCCSSFAGKWEKIGGIDSYVATPTGDYAKDKIVLLLPDIFGPQLINSQVSLS